MLSEKQWLLDEVNENLRKTRQEMDSIPPGAHNSYGAGQLFGEWDTWKAIRELILNPPVDLDDAEVDEVLL